MIKNYNGLLTDYSKKLILGGKSNILIKDFKGTLNIELEDEADIILNFYSNKKLGKINLSIKQNSNSKIKIIESFVTESKLEYNLTNEVIGNNNYFEVKIRGYAKEDTLITLLAKVNDKTINNEIIQDVKIIKEDCKVLVEPNVEVYTDDVIANHMVSIYDATDEELFYLKSKGLNKKQAKELIKNGLLYGSFNDKIKTLIKED